MVTLGSLKQIVLLLSFVFEITTGQKTLTKWLQCCLFWCSRGNTSRHLCFSKTIFNRLLALQSMYKNPRFRKANSQTHTVLQLRLHFQSPLLADHVLPVSHTALFLVLTCSSRSLFSSGLSSEAASPSLLEAIDKLAVVAQDSKTAKPITHTRFSLQKSENYTLKRFLWNTLGKHLVLFLFLSFRLPWTQT